MQKRIFTLSIVLMTMIVSVAFAQSEATTPPMSFNIAKEVKPPLWEIVEEPHFVDADGNNTIDANEQCRIVMKIKNIGMGDGMGLTAKISAKGTTNGISIADHKLPTIPVNSTRTIEFPINTDMNTADGAVEFTVYVDEPLGFSTDPYIIRIRSRKFQEPLIVVKDYVVSGVNGGTLKRQMPFSLEILVQNTQQGLGENVHVELQYPNNVFNSSGNDLYTYSELLPGESKRLSYNLIISNKYEGATLPLKVKIREKYGRYAQDKEIDLTLDQPLLAGRTIEVESQVARTDIMDAQLRSDVDRDIPKTSKNNSHRFAIIIGNQDYHTYQTGLEQEQDVPFAVEDANVFKQYCIHTLGFMEDNVVLLNNATSAKMKQEIDWITRLASRDPQSEIVFYYAGHGYPNEATKEPYLIPVDVNANSLSTAIPLYELYAKLANSGASKVTIFLDACFSGGGRDVGLVASRGVKITPKKDILTGNVVVFSATTADQSALPYNDKHHGMFTYFLLKMMKETNGDFTYKELYEYLKKNVDDSCLRVNRKEQTPEVNTSYQVQDVWENWKF